ncbi:hypothetical protein ACFSL6_16695 [Paenibacillus thailandensis]|uniref:Uncharacterized protein n=1 Tax=Paenibacillus thailandensis TaxID=393250 RepID=A0ABW5QZS6_9BACL
MKQPRKKREPVSRSDALGRIDRASGWLLAALALLLTMLVVFQFALQSDKVRHAVNDVEKWEGASFP